MRVGMASVVMINRHPVEAGAEITLHLHHKRSGTLAQIAKRNAIFRRNDDAELVAVHLAAIKESRPIRRRSIASVEITALSIPFYTIALDIMKMRPKGPKPTPFTRPRNMEFHNDTPHPEGCQSLLPEFKLSRSCASATELAARISCIPGLPAKLCLRPSKLVRKPVASGPPAIPYPAKPWRELIIDGQNCPLQPGAPACPDSQRRKRKIPCVSNPYKGHLKNDVQTRR